MPPASRRPSPLTREDVVESALRLTGERGLSALSMRALANDLAVTPMALYHYVHDKQELMQLVLSEVSTRWVPLRTDGGSWEDGLRRHLLSMWEELARYPGLGAQLAQQPRLGVSDAGMEAGVEYFVLAGFTRRSAMLAWSFALTYIHGRLGVEARQADAPRPRGSGLRARDHATYGVDAVVAGIRALHERADSSPVRVGGIQRRVTVRGRAS